MVKTGTLFHVDGAQIKSIDDRKLQQLVDRLLYVEAYLLGLPPSQAFVGADLTTADDGLDGYSPPHESDDEYLPKTETCWQLKAGAQSQASRIAPRGEPEISEFAKSIPAQVLHDGGTYILVASASANAKKGDVERHTALVESARALGLPEDRIRVYGAEKLARWCTARPSVAAWFNGVVAAASTLEQQLRDSRHQRDYWASETIKRELTEYAEKISPRNGTIKHLHIQGFPGSGKTRFALELAKQAEWAQLVVWFQQANTGAETTLAELARVEHLKSSAILVVDECDAASLDRLNSQLAICGPSVRLITIGVPYSDIKSEVVTKVLEPIGDAEMASLVQSLEVGMPPEQVDFCVRVCGGYVKLAFVAAPAIRRDPPKNPAELLQSDQIHSLLDKLLPEVENREDLLVPALFLSLGWTKDAAIEGKTVAEALGLDWHRMQRTVAKAHDTHGIAPLAGKRRYISPLPLANYLAIEALGRWKKRLIEIVNAIGFPAAAKQQFYARLGELAGTPEGRQICETELESFFDLAAFADDGQARAWATYSRANPEKAAANLLTVLQRAGKAAAREFGGTPRREIVWALERLVWPTRSFRSALLALAELSLAENENYANNATATFLGCFRLHLGGTAMSFQNRLEILDEMMRMGPEYESLGIRALAVVVHHHEHRLAAGERQAGVREPEWRPQTRQEDIDSRIAAIRRLVHLAQEARSSHEELLTEIATESYWPLVGTGFYEIAGEFVSACAKAFPGKREQFRRSVARAASFLENDKFPAVASAVQKLHDSLVDVSFIGRLQRYVGDADFHITKPTPEMEQLAKETNTNVDLVRPHLAWLCSSAAHSAWFFGDALGSAIRDNRLDADVLESVSDDNDPRFAIGFFLSRARAEGGTWLADFIGRLSTDDRFIRFCFELLWRADFRSELLPHLLTLISSESLSIESTRSLSFSGWTRSSPEPVVRQIIKAILAREGGLGPALVLLASRLHNNEKESKQFEDLILVVCRSSRLLIGRHDLDYEWAELALLVAQNHPGEISSTIFEAQASKSGWFAEHSRAEEVLERVVEVDSRAVWRSIRPFLEDDEVFPFFIIGFPVRTMLRLPENELLDWIQTDPANRASKIIHTLGPDFASDDRLVAKLIHRYGKLKKVSSAAHSVYVTGGWSGPSSFHWDAKAEQLEGVAASTSLDGLRQWAKKVASELRAEAIDHREIEAEEKIMGH